MQAQTQTQIQKCFDWGMIQILMRLNYFDSFTNGFDAFDNSTSSSIPLIPIFSKKYALF